MWTISVRNMIFKKKGGSAWLLHSLALLKYREDHLSQNCFLGSLSWKEFTMGLTYVLTCYHHLSLHTVNHIWPLFCSINTPTTQTLLSLRCFKIQTICKIISENVSISVHLTTEKAKLLCNLFQWKNTVISQQVGLLWLWDWITLASLAGDK